uniref:Uncharacterized protein n=1 Tax=Ananas comosus var. bracteatus TaxID=296719 RepID=A0A6V7PY58_ANACO|nr:unnamed protein product [Ananas comosus var. bracteatus]
MDRLFAELHGIPLVFLLHPEHVVVPDHTLDIREYYPSCPVRVGDWIIPVDLLALRKLGDFDVVLGMDCLTKYYATIDCKNRPVTFREPGHTEVVFRGCRSSLFAMSISSSRARQLISRGCVAYLASVVLRGEDDTHRIEDIPVVREFQDVFPAELPASFFSLSLIVRSKGGKKERKEREERKERKREEKKKEKMEEMREIVAIVILFVFFFSLELLER